MNKIFTGLFIVSMLSSCVTSTIVIDVQRPADITISQDVKNLVVVNDRPSSNLAKYYGRYNYGEV